MSIASIAQKYVYCINSILEYIRIHPGSRAVRGLAPCRHLDSTASWATNIIDIYNIILQCHIIMPTPSCTLQYNG